MYTFLVVIECAIAFLLIGSILLQQGKGADMGSGFGAGVGGALFGPTGATSFLTRATQILAAVFFANTLALAIFSRGLLQPIEGEISRFAPEAEQVNDFADDFENANESEEDSSDSEE